MRAMTPRDTAMLFNIKVGKGVLVNTNWRFSREMFLGRGLAEKVAISLGALKAIEINQSKGTKQKTPHPLSIP